MSRKNYFVTWWQLAGIGIILAVFVASVATNYLAGVELVKSVMVSIIQLIFAAFIVGGIFVFRKK